MPTPQFYSGGNVAKSVKKPWRGLGLLVGLGFAWTKLGLGAAAKDVGAVAAQIPLKPDGTCPPGWTQLGNKCVKL